MISRGVPAFKCVLSHKFQMWACMLRSLLCSFFFHYVQSFSCSESRTRPKVLISSFQGHTKASVSGAVNCETLQTGFRDENRSRRRKVGSAA